MKISKYGLDLGTYEIKIYDNDNKMIQTERPAGTLEDIRTAPVKNGVVVQPHVLNRVIDRMLPVKYPSFQHKSFLLAVPKDITGIERRSFLELGVSSAAREVRVIERSVADGIGMGIDIDNTSGCMIINIGGGTAECSVISHGSLVLSRMLRTCGGLSLKKSVGDMVLRETGMIISVEEEDKLLGTFGICGRVEEASLNISGVFMRDGSTVSQQISAAQVWKAVQAVMNPCVQTIHFFIRRVPPQIRSAIKRNGLYLCGGNAGLKGLVQYLEEQTEIQVHRQDQPEFSTVHGLKEVVTSERLWEKTYTRLDENDRWKR